MTTTTAPATPTAVEPAPESQHREAEPPRGQEEPGLAIRLQRAALWYAARGCHVFPCYPGKKAPAVDAWHRAATTDPYRIRRWWDGDRTPNIGIACGPSHLVVIDCDTDKQRPVPTSTPTVPGDLAAATEPAPTGELAYRALAAQHGHLATDLDTWTVNTPSGGRHFYYTAPAGVEVRNSASTFAARTDVRATGGYVLAPPSVLAGGGGGRYEVAVITNVAPLPGWVRDRFADIAARRAHTIPRRASAPVVQPYRPATAALDARIRGWVAAGVRAETARVRHAASGTRNCACFTAGVALGQLVGGGFLPATAALDALMDAASTHVGVDGFTATEAHTAFVSGLTRGQTEPRQLPATMKEAS